MSNKVTTENINFSRWLSKPEPGEEVVISGVSGRFPNSKNVQEYCDHLFKKEDMTTDDDRTWQLNHPEIPKKFGKLWDLNNFDPGFFGIHYRQADVADPMMRILLEVVIESILDAGLNPLELQGTKTAVFVSVSWSDTEIKTLIGITEPEQFGLTGCIRSLIARRISYFLKLNSCSIVVDTACSSSMNALDLAFKAIRTGQCDRAIVSGCNLILHPGTSLQFFRMGVLSYEGVCRVFDQEAKGYVRGETIASIFLEKSSLAKRIYAEIINSKPNSDGYKYQGITFPSTHCQSQLITEIYDDSEIHPDRISFIEAHGTGTQVGDPQEVEAIDVALGKKRSKPLFIGSVKSYLGHTEPVSGLCSVVKVLLAMENRIVPPNIHLKNLKKGLRGCEEGRLIPITDFLKLTAEDTIFGINNFGFGGSNVHVILKRFMKKKNLVDDNVARLICVSGRTEEAVSVLLNQIVKFDPEYFALLHEIFKLNFENHCYRGFAIISKMGVLKKSIKLRNFYNPPLYIFFGSFLKKYSIFNLYLQQFPVYQKSIFTIYDVTKIPAVDMSDSENLLASVVVQLGFVDVLKAINLKAEPIYFDAIGEIVASYYNGTKTLQETISSALKATKPNFNTNLSLSVLKIREKVSKTAFILNISDIEVNTQFLSFIDGTKIKFLDILGRLYESGYCFQLQNLYPKINYPVSAGTQMISPLIKWKHDKTWSTFKFQEFIVTDAEQREYQLSYLDEEPRYLQGHVIDGRNLIPATEYLNLVWQSYAYSKRRLISDTAVVFTNCKFVRATTMPKTSFVTILVLLQRGTGRFEVLEKDTVLVTGRIHEQKSDSSDDSEAVNFEEKNSKEILEEDEIYRELYLRGYNYSGIFKGIKKCNIDASAGLIEWEDNWTSFIDKMLQMKILQLDSRLLFVPVGINKLVINPKKHMAVIDKLDNDKKLVPVISCKHSNIVKSGGIEISGLIAKSISKRKSKLEPVLEKYQFVSNSAKVGLLEAIRFNIQIIIENSLVTNFKAVEVINEFTDSNLEYLLPLVSKTLDDVPVVIPELIISTKNVSEEIPGIKFDKVALNSESNLTLLITSKLYQQKSAINQLLLSLEPSGFILTRENLEDKIDTWNDIDIVTEYVTPKEKLILLKKREQIPDRKFLEITSENFDWLCKLQELLRVESNIVVYSKNENDGILGFINCLRREPNRDKINCFLITKEAPDFDPINPFYSQQIDKNLAINVYKDKSWGTYRHLLLEDCGKVESENYFADVTSIGDISSLKWLENNIDKNYLLPNGQSVISVYYSGLNFKDVMIASGRVSIESFVSNRFGEETLLGLEFSGKNANGSRVFGILPKRGFASYVIPDQVFLWKTPDSWSLSDAATVPIVYTTVLFALVSTANIQKYSSILIHSATGGIGLAAINVCLHYKCKIYLTVGTQEKREFLRKNYPQIPDSHIGNSRDTTFEEMIKIQTCGRGVDIVLNSLSDDKLKASVRCLAHGGKFLEIGKYDLFNDTSLELLFMEKDASYHGIMLDKAFTEPSSKNHQLMKLVEDGIQAGFIKPLPRIVFEKEQLEEAFRYLMPGKHIGKILLKIRDEEQKSALPQDIQFKVFPRYNAKMKNSYIIIGGLGGIGLELGEWLILRGAKNLVLVSRIGIQSGYQAQKINNWKKNGVNVTIFTKNISTKLGCIELINEAKTLGEVDGVFNLGVILRDSLFENQTTEAFLESFAPKAYATQHLDQVTRELCPDLRHFVVFSSVSCGRGNAGQTNYGMANSIMENICYKRQRDGLPGLAIQWGAIGDVGLVAKMQKENKELVIGGTLQQKISSCLQVLDKFLTQNNPIVSSIVVAEKRKKNSNIDSAVNVVADILGVKDLKTVDENASLAELGLDSIMGTEIMQILEKEFDIFVTAKDIRNLTFKKLAQLEADRKNELNDSTKIQQINNFIIQFVPNSKCCSEPTIQLNGNSKKQTILLLPGIEGIFTPLQLLSQEVNANLVGVEYDYFKHENTIEEIASKIIKNVEATITEESFLLIGYSFGGLIALQIANYLEKKGRKGQVILIDSSPDYLKKLIKTNFPQQQENELQTAYLFKILSFFIPTSIFLPEKEKFLNCNDLNERIELAISLVPSEVSSKQKLNKEAGIIVYKRFKAILNYDSTQLKIKSKIHLIKANLSIGEDKSYGLEKIAQGSLNVMEVDGDHISIMNHTNLTKMINQIIN